MSYEFLGIPAGYDINQYLIPYNNRDTHLRAAIVGLLNTGLVAICGIIAATIFGLFLGVLRLSKNWLASRIAYWYVEFTRNVPILLHILLWHGIIINTLPHPKKAIDIGEMAFLTNRGFYIPKPITENGIELVYLFSVIAIIFSVLFYKYAKKKQEEAGIQYPKFLISLGIFIIVPALTFIFGGVDLSWSFPELKQLAKTSYTYDGGVGIPPELIALTLALTLYTATFIAENVRAGIQGIGKGQKEAAASIGLTPGQVLKLVIMPQALRIIIPPTTNQYLNLTKNSSLAAAIAYPDLVLVFAGTAMMQTGRAIEIVAITMATYLTISLSISLFMNWYNKSIAIKEK